MPPPRGLAEQFGAEDLPEAVPVPVDIVVPDASPEPKQQQIAELQASLAAMTARVAELEAPPQELWQPLKAAAYDCGMVYETLRAWCDDGDVQARREGKLWYVNVTSVKERQRRLGQRK